MDDEWNGNSPADQTTALVCDGKHRHLDPVGSRTVLTVSEASPTPHAHGVLWRFASSTCYGYRPELLHDLSGHALGTNFHDSGLCPIADIHREAQDDGQNRCVVHKTVLIVDDNAFIRHALYELFQRQEDFDVCGIAENGREAIELAGQRHPDLIVLDLSMPVMNGLEAARVLKRLLPRVPLIMYSAFGDPLSGRQARMIGISEVVSKSDPASRLLEKARTLAYRNAA